MECAVEDNGQGVERGKEKSRIWYSKKEQEGSRQVSTNVESASFRLRVDRWIDQGLIHHRSFFRTITKATLNNYFPHVAYNSKYRMKDIDEVIPRTSASVAESS